MRRLLSFVIAAGLIVWGLFLFVHHQAYGRTMQALMLVTATTMVAIGIGIVWSEFVVRRFHDRKKRAENSGDEERDPRSQ